MKTNPRHPAFFPLPYPMNSEEEKQAGLTKREYFASEALAGLLGNYEAFGPIFQGNEEGLAEKAVGLADALIKELNKEIK